MRDRLIELIKNAKAREQADVLFGDIDDVIDMPSGDEYLANYLLANGVIVPPCKVGQTVYIIDEPDFEDDYVLEVQVIGAGRDIGGVWVTIDLPLGMKRSRYIGATEIGKTVYLTREDAERALKEGEHSGC